MLLALIGGMFKNTDNNAKAQVMATLPQSPGGTSCLWETLSKEAVCSLLAAHDVIRGALKARNLELTPKSRMGLDPGNQEHPTSCPRSLLHSSVNLCLFRT